MFAKKCDIDLDDCGICVIQAGGDSVLQLIQLAEKFGIPCIGIRDSDGDNTPTSIPNLWKTTERDFEAELMKLIDIGREEVLCDILCEYDSEKQERILNAQALNKRAYKKIWLFNSTYQYRPQIIRYRQNKYHKPKSLLFYMVWNQ